MTFTRHLRNLRRRWPLLALMTVLGLGLGFVTTPDADAVGAEDVYWQATHTLVVENPGSVNLAQAAFFTSVGEVPRRVADEFGGTIPADVRTRTVDLVGTLQIIAIGRDGATATRVAESYGKHLLDYLRTTAQEQQESERDTVINRLESLESRIAELDASLAANPNQDVVQAQRDALVNQYRLVYDRFQQLAEREGVSVGLAAVESGDAVPITEGQRNLVLAGPTVESDTSRRGREEVSTVPTARGAAEEPLGRTARTALGGLAGLMAGIGAAVILDRVDTRIRSKEDAEAAFGYPVIGEIPPLTRRQRRRHELFSMAHGGSRPAESYRALRTSVVFAGRASDNGDSNHNGHSQPHRSSGTAVQGPRVILVTSPGPSEGKTTSSANLAAAFAEAGASVLVVGCDFRRPRIQDHLHFAEGPVLADVRSAADIELSQMARPTQVPGVSLAETAEVGQPIANPAALVALQRELVAMARGKFDVILLDTAPLLTTNDASDLLTVADIVLVICRNGKTTADAAARSSELLERLAAPVGGVVLVGMRELPSGKRYYYYSSSTGQKDEATAGPALEAPAPTDLGR